MYLHGLAYYLLAAVMTLSPEWAPLELAGLSAAHGVTVFLFLRRSDGNTADAASSRD